jgi:hypothetical protein
MATPDPNDIKNAQEALNDYNDKLRESINLSRIISDNIAMLAGGMNKVGKEGRDLITDLNIYSKSLTKTINLSDKLASGKLKEKEVTEQLANIAAKYQQLQDESVKQGGYIQTNLSKQATLQREINDGEIKVSELKDRITIQNENFLDQQQRLASATARYYNANNVQEKARAAERMAIIKDEVTNTNLTLNFLEKQQSIEEKIIDTKKQELNKVENIIDAHAELVSKYEEERRTNEAILNALKKQKSISGEIKDEFEKIGDRIKNSIKSVFSLTAVFEYLKKVALQSSENVTKLQKGLVLSREEAYDVRQEFNNIAVASGDVAVNTNRITEATTALGKQLGFNSKFTPDLNIQFIKLTKQIGLSEEAAGGLAKLSIATGATLKESKNTALGVSQALSSQYGIQLDQREVLEEVGKISGQTLAMFKGSVPALAQAVAQAKLLGTNLDNAKKQASSLLNFETSIENELQAELLTGQQLNLERARTAALTGDLTTVMKELNNQNIDFNKFSNMNVIAQDKVAAALGLSSDELSDQLLKQQYMGKSTKEVAALAGEEVAKRLEALNAQDKFNLAMEKMQDIVSKIVGGPLGQLADLIATISSSATVLYTTLGLIAGISLAKLILSIASMVAGLNGAAVGAAATSAFLNPVNLAIGAAALLTTVGLISGIMADATTTKFAEGGLVYGKTNAIVGEYAGAANNPEVIAPLSDLQNIIDNSNRQTAAAQDNLEMIRLFTDMRNELRATRENTGKFVDKKLVASIEKGFVQGFGTEQMKGQTLFA